MKNIVSMIFLLLLFSCSQLNMHENEEVCYLHIYVELPEGYQVWPIGFIQFLREFTEEERNTLMPYITRFISHLEPKRITPKTERILIIKKNDFQLVGDTIFFRLRGFECFLEWKCVEDYLIYKQGDTIFKYYDFSDKECMPLTYE